MRSSAQRLAAAAKAVSAVPQAISTRVRRKGQPGSVARLLRSYVASAKKPKSAPANTARVQGTSAAAARPPDQAAGATAKRKTPAGYSR